MSGLTLPDNGSHTHTHKKSAFGYGKLATKRSSPAVQEQAVTELFGKMPGHKGIIVNIGNARPETKATRASQAGPSRGRLLNIIYLCEIWQIYIF